MEDYWGNNGAQAGGDANANGVVVGGDGDGDGDVEMGIE